MKFQILSHAGLMVEKDGIQLLNDPWIKGSCYWRSWWNYPPVSEELINSLKPNFIYLTHTHWDHFQAVSLRLFPKNTPIIVPLASNGRILRDLKHLGFDEIIPLRHGESLKLGPDFELVCYHFCYLGYTVDSAIIVKDKDTTLLNLNDSKFMGLPLSQIIKENKPIDFVFTGFSSANSRFCYEVMGSEMELFDDLDRYIRNFYLFSRATGARFAVPFADNHCYLHKDSFQYNQHTRTPSMVKEYWEKNKIKYPELKVMVSGDSWSSKEGFKISPEDWDTNRKQRLEEYAKEKEPTLQKFYQKEEEATLSLEEVEKHFLKFSKALPFFIRRIFKKHSILFVLTAGENQFIYQVNLWSGEVVSLDSYDDKTHGIQFHTTAYIIKHCIAADHFTSLGCSRRVRYRLALKEMKYCQFLEILFCVYESETFPLKNFLRLWVLQSWFARWREFSLFAGLGLDYFMTGKINFERHLKPAAEDPIMEGRVTQTEKPGKALLETQEK